ncbi:MAG: hypothetical protein JXM69_20655 [Anaerolineae bacterium]|nr:hypothetical protein [Anaerolineae bacterium]
MGYLIWTAIKNAAVDFWDEMLYLFIFNVIWLVGTLLIIPWPFVTFGLFAIAYDVGQGKGIKFGSFFGHAAQVWKQAYIWGGINIGLIIVLLVNIRFYGNIEAPWAVALQIIIIGIVIFWLVLQLIALAIYPRLEEPGFKLAVRNAAVVFARYPVAILILLVLIVALVIASFFLQILFIVATFSMIAVATNRMVGAAVTRELQRGSDEEAE